MRDAEPSAQRVGGWGWWTDLEQRPALVVQAPKRASGIFFTALGVVLLAVSGGIAAVLVPRHGSSGGEALTEFAMVALIALGGGLYCLVTGLRDLERRRICFYPDSVEVEGRDLRGRIAFAEAYSAFDGVQLRTRILPRKHGAWEVTTVDLVHPQPRRTLRLLCYEASAPSQGPPARDALARYAELLGVPVLPDASFLTNRGRTRAV